MGVVISISTLTLIDDGLRSNLQIYAQTENETESSEEMEKSDMTVATGPEATIPSMSTPGEKTFYVLTSEEENVDEEKLKIAGDSFDVKILVADRSFQHAIL